MAWFREEEIKALFEKLVVVEDQEWDCSKILEDCYNLLYLLWQGKGKDSIDRRAYLKTELNKSLNRGKEEARQIFDFYNNYCNILDIIYEEGQLGEGEDDD